MNSSTRALLMGGLSGLALAGAPAMAQTAPETKPQEIIVTGSYLGNVRQEDRASPIVSVDSKALEKTGVASIGDLTRFIPQNVGSTGGMQDLQKGGADTRDTRSANLRGLGSGATLVLLNGRRVTPQAGDGYVNLNSLTPDIAVNRVETVLDGASSTYGADAVAGVFNLITNTKFTGVKMSAQFISMDKSPAWNVQAMVGLGNDRIHSVFSASYRFQDNLQNGDRAVTNFFNASTTGYPGRFVLYGRPQTSTGGNVIINGNNYTALYDANKAANGMLTVVDPNCGLSGTSSLYLPTAGATFGLGNCAYSYQAQNPIRPQSKSLNIHNDTTFEVAPGHTIYAELSYYHQDSSRYGVPSYAQTHNGATPPLMPASNPYNPFGVTIGFLGRAIGAQGFAGTYQYRVMRDTVNQQHYVLGARGKLFNDWKYAISATYSGSHTIARDKDTDMNLFQAALNGYGGPNCNIRFNGAGSGAVAGAGNCLWYSPFQADNAKQDPALLYNLQTDEFSDFKNEYFVGEAVANGSLVTINGHSLDVAVGVQARKEKSRGIYSDLLLSGFGGFIGPARNYSYTRNVKSAFVEANYEVIDGLNVNAAARYEDYGGFNSTAPKVAVNWRVLPQISLRGSLSRAFQAPAIANSSNALISTGVGNITDPKDGTTTFRTIATYGNPNLKPQTADVFNFGATFLPVPKMRLSVDFWQFKYNNQIQTQGAQAVISANPNSSAVIRDTTTGSAQTINVTSFNATSGTKTSGIDVAAQYGFNVGKVQVTLRDAVTYLLKYDIDTGSVVYDGIGYRNAFNQSPGSASAAPRWRSVAGADFAYGTHDLSITWRYTSGVLDDYGLNLGAAPTDRIKAFSVFDVQYTKSFGADDRFSFTAGMINAFDTAPGFAKFNGYLPSISDPFGRQIYARVGAKF
ncbi:TonB-dependent receptor plug domain-containing protein [Novosphingobium humi]|uniref:TonB-dependent receptor n=1 Tax=Novosphingobium humi TaxID=2282397 RepID=A0ABY7U1Y2_9SPHN|nr:TonB-dependent receptor [Novosphingobium humi]WCT79513.1 TonB-dependent receptor [Novosphingobium humi]